MQISQAVISLQVVELQIPLSWQEIMDHSLCLTYLFSILLQRGLALRFHHHFYLSKLPLIPNAAVCSESHGRTPDS